MINKRNKSFVFLVPAVVCMGILLIFYLGKHIEILEPIQKIFEETQIKDVVNIVAILSGISGILIGAASIRISNLGAVKEYFQQGDAEGQRAARRKIYNKIENNENIDKNDSDAGNVISLYVNCQGIKCHLSE